MPTELVNFTGSNSARMARAVLAEIWILTLLSVLPCVLGIAAAIQFPRAFLPLAALG